VAHKAGADQADAFDGHEKTPKDGKSGYHAFFRRVIGICAAGPLVQFFNASESRGAMTKGPEPTFAELFTPKLVTVWREGYGAEQLRADAVAGLTVAIVALPLSMAIAIASGVGPERGLYSAIIGGFIVSLLGGSRFQVGGPAGAFIVLVAAAVAKHGIDGMLLATFMSGLMLLAIGYLRLGTYIKFIPYPVTVGFTAGIAVFIFASQIKDFLGLTLRGAEPGPLMEKLPALFSSLPTVTPAAMAVGAATVAVIVLTKRFAPRIPGMLAAVLLASVLTLMLGLSIETIGSKFGDIPRSLPFPALPVFSVAKVLAVLPDALSFALLGAIESLLSAVVADGMSGRRHRSNCELAAQGYANIAAALFGGVPVTGTIARTATNVRSGAHGPVAGMLHALFLLAFMMLAAPLASLIPLAALAGVLIHVAWNMAEKAALLQLTRSSREDALIVLSTFLLTIFVDLATGILAGFAIGSVVFINRMAGSISVEAGSFLPAEDQADDAHAKGGKAFAGSKDVAVYKITGAFFFGAASTVSAVMERIADRHKAFIVDVSGVPFLDSSGANAMEALARRAHKRGVILILAGGNESVVKTLRSHGVRTPEAHFASDMPHAAEIARRHLRKSDG
jgi:sulfate permease, SulP family